MKEPSKSVEWLDERCPLTLTHEEMERQGGDR